MRRIAPQKRHGKIFIQFETQQKIGRRAKLGGGQNQNKLSETRVAGDSNAKKMWSASHFGGKETI